jgi:hypothetical protein
MSNFDGSLASMSSEDRYKQASDSLNELHGRFRKLRNFNLASLGVAVVGAGGIVFGLVTGHNVLQHVEEGVGAAALVGGLGGFVLSGVDINSMVPEETRLIAEKKQYRPQPTE